MANHDIADLVTEANRPNLSRARRPAAGKTRPARILIGILNRQRSFTPPMKLTNIPAVGAATGGLSARLRGRSA